MVTPPSTVAAPPSPLRMEARRVNVVSLTDANALLSRIVIDEDILNGEVIILLDISKCLYDAISRMEKATEQGSAITAAVEGMESQWGNIFTVPHTFIETLMERMFRPSLSIIIGEQKKGILTSKDIIIQITHAAIYMVESSSEAINDIANTLMQMFWDSALALKPPDDYDTQSEMCALKTSDGVELGRYPSLSLEISFAFKFEDL
ncbi:unnamed protein product [Dovyalis caffra]|uniref:Uncharacterized protein n=1 Tax=Dovyalis caffra TaxID=77055 RepID=A0AAV1QV75_9ROSI|nr:unnamed protein product [Dovyalis caffra]